MILSISLATASTPPFLYAGEIAATLSAFVWACAGIGFARVPGPMSGAALNLGKNLTATIGFAILLLVARGNPFPFDGPTESVLFLVGSGVVGLAICDTFLMRALLQIGPQRAMLIFCLAPVVTAVGASFPPYSEPSGPDYRHRDGGNGGRYRVGGPGTTRPATARRGTFAVA